MIRWRCMPDSCCILGVRGTHVYRLRLSRSLWDIVRVRAELRARRVVEHVLWVFMYTWFLFNDYWHTRCAQCAHKIRLYIDSMNGIIYILTHLCRHAFALAKPHVAVLLLPSIYHTSVCVTVFSLPFSFENLKFHPACVCAKLVNSVATISENTASNGSIPATMTGDICICTTGNCAFLFNVLANLNSVLNAQNLEQNFWSRKVIAFSAFNFWNDQWSICDLPRFVA